MVKRISDAEHKARGTFKPGKSDEARAAGQVAKILAFPVMREIPPCGFPVNDHGQRTFDHWTRRLLDAGLLTETSISQIENLALQDHVISARMAEGKEPPNRAIEVRRQILHWLEQMNVSESVVSGQKKKSAFASNGFPSRLRTPAEHRARVAR